MMRNALCGLVLVFGVAAIHAQAPVKVIVAVRDPSGAVIPKAEVSVSEIIKLEAPYIQVMRPGTEKQVASAATGTTGETRFSLPLGSYRIAVFSPGFRELRTPLEITGPSEQRVDAVLQLASFSGPGIVPAPEELPLASEPLMEMIPGVSVHREFTLSPRPWPRKRKPHGQRSP